MNEKIFRDTRTQIGILISRGVIIRNKSKAKKLLRSVNYYNLINGYKTPFIKQNKPYEKYIEGTRLEEIFSVYEFDRKLRILTLEVILEIEKKIKSLVAYHFSKIYGHKDYLIYKNFNTDGVNKYKQVSNLLSKLHQQIFINIDNEVAIKHYADGKNHIPLWVLVNSMSMGDISKFYANMKSSDKIMVAKLFKWGIRENQLSNCLYFIANIRNRCAHDELLYSYITHATLSNNKYFKYFRITYTNNYFAFIISIKMLLSKKDFNIFVNNLEKLFVELESNLYTIPINKVKKLMGIPNNWKKLQALN